MKLTCDICGGELEMKTGGQGAVCKTCGLAYSVEVLKEKMAASGGAGVRTSHTAEEPIYDCKSYEVLTAQPKRMLRLKSKRSLTLFVAQAYLDGEPCAVLKGTGSTAEIPVSQGEHEIAFRIATAQLDELGPMTFRVDDKDWNGVLYLQRGAFRANYKFEMWEED